MAQLTGCKNYSPIRPLAPHKLHALAWNCTLETQAAVSPHHIHVGIRAHQITFPNRADAPNTGLAWVAHTSETPHHMTVFLKLGAAPADADDYHLRAEVFKDQWTALNQLPLPWPVGLAPQRLLLLSQG